MKSRRRTRLAKFSANTQLENCPKTLFIWSFTNTSGITTMKNFVTKKLLGKLNGNQSQSTKNKSLLNLQRRPERAGRRISSRRAVGGKLLLRRRRLVVVVLPPPLCSVRFGRGSQRHAALQGLQICQRAAVPAIPAAAGSAAGGQQDAAAQGLPSAHADGLIAAQAVLPRGLRHGPEWQEAGLGGSSAHSIH